MNKSKLRMEKSGDKLDAARDNLAAQKPQKKPGPVKSLGRAAKFQAWKYAHGKINQVEHENVGIEAAHKTELAGETVFRGSSRFIKRRIRTRPARQVRKWESKHTKARADHAFQKLAQDNPELKKNALSRFYHKQRIKRKYQKQAKEAAKHGAKAAQKTVNTVEKITVAAWGFVKRHPKMFLIITAFFWLSLSCNPVWRRHFQSVTVCWGRWAALPILPRTQTLTGPSLPIPSGKRICI